MVKKSQERHLCTCIQLLITKRPSRNVLNFRHLLGCDIIGCFFCMAFHVLLHGFGCCSYVVKLTNFLLQYLITITQFK